jgi:hypothetical protein
MQFICSIRRRAYLPLYFATINEALQYTPDFSASSTQLEKFFLAACLAELLKPPLGFSFASAFFPKTPQ